MKRKSFIVSGDSWGCGEWAKTSNGYRTTHGGLAQWLHQSGNCVYNLSQPGGSNSESVQRIANFCEHNPWLNLDGVFVFETEWTRDILSSHSHKKHFASLHDAEQDFKHRFYDSLIELSKKIKLPVYVIGGQSDTLNGLRLSRDSAGVEIVCQSLVNLAVADSAYIDQPVFAIWHNHNQHLLSIVPDNATTKQELIDRVDQSTARLNLLATQQQWFWPDGMHANRHAHEKLWRHLITNHASIFE